jgi:methanogenic corrinoid protein MtbC1
MNDCGGSLEWLGEVADFQQKVGLPQKASETLLTTIIEREIIPRLLLTHSDPPEASGEQGRPVAMVDSEELTRLVLGDEPIEKVMEHLQSLLDGGESLQRIYLDLLAPIAGRLGEYWLEDRCTFIDLTLALSRLHWLLRELGRHNGEAVYRSSTKKRIYLAATPGEQHSFGLVMIEEFFLHAGWEMAYDHMTTNQSILQAIHTHDVDVVGLSIANVELLGPLQDLIAMAGKASSNRKARIMVGGRLFKDHPEIVDKISGATVVADGVNAVEFAENLIGPSPRSGPVEQPR